MASIAEVLDEYLSLREQAHRYLADHIAPQSDDWVLRLVSDYDIAEMKVDGPALLCSGRVWSNRTQDTEDFEFRVPLGVLKVGAPG